MRKVFGENAKNVKKSTKFMFFSITLHPYLVDIQTPALTTSGERSKYGNMNKRRRREEKKKMCGEQNASLKLRQEKQRQKCK